MSSLPGYPGVSYIRTESPGLESKAKHIKYILQTYFGAYFGLRVFVISQISVVFTLATLPSSKFKSWHVLHSGIYLPCEFHINI